MPERGPWRATAGPPLSRRRWLLLALLAGPCTVNAAPDLEALARQVSDAERAFARSMAERDHAAFTALLSEQARFFSGRQVLRGKAAVLAHWERFFQGPAAPFSWRPEIIEVLASGELAYSEGPVSLPDGRVVGRYFSTCRRGPDGGWQVVIDPAIPTTRTNEQPYKSGMNYTTIIDGFIVSPNITVEEVRGLDLGFAITDHQPVIATLSLTQPEEPAPSEGTSP